MGADIARGELLQLLVGPGVWKVSRLLPEDLASTSGGPADDEQRERTGCLITEVVFPGFHWGDHTFMDVETLKGLWNGQEGWQEFVEFVKKD